MALLTPLTDCERGKCTGGSESWGSFPTQKTMNLKKRILYFARSFFLAYLVAASALAAARLRAGAPIPAARASKVEKRVGDILKQLTLAEKIGLCSGSRFRGVPLLNIPDLQLTDGPHGIHGGGRTTAFAAGVLFGATWNPGLIREAGQVMGNETRASGECIVLGPGINIQRNPLGSRFFEYFQVGAASRDIRSTAKIVVNTTDFQKNEVGL